MEKPKPLRREGAPWADVFADACGRDLYNAQVAREQGVSEAAVSMAASRLGVKLRPGPKGRHTVKVENWAAVLSEAREAGVSSAAVARACGVTRAAVIKAQRVHGIRLAHAHARGR